ncbi:hypothetical protein LQ956_14610 [Ectothiorhodospira sp. A-7Y]|nr:hypothetical protein [Ectothiorhodospira lacustris]MCG5502132.1 hypothetical protein [Ectothiorhodospira lacustris]MCG5511472.1 hypothetical protein [Ectothiorhodospira lacustris]MCG5523249.1 hypothetical protein [Ectothiorhodospira lacustris]
MAGPEYTDVEKPFIDQLVGQGWAFLARSMDDPAVTHRDSFAQVVMEPLLRRQLRAINLRDGKPWLDDGRLDQAVAAITCVWCLTPTSWFDVNTPLPSVQ